MSINERAVLAGGCFWGMQDLIRKMNGVISTRVGYSGGDVANATYRNHGSHAEAIESRSASPPTPSPTWTHPACGRGKSSPRSRRRARSGKQSRSTRITCSAFRTATPAISCGRVGRCRSGTNRLRLETMS